MKIGKHNEGKRDTSATSHIGVQWGPCVAGSLSVFVTVCDVIKFGISERKAM